MMNSTRQIIVYFLMSSALCCNVAFGAASAGESSTDLFIGEAADSSSESDDSFDSAAALGARKRRRSASDTGSLSRVSSAGVVDGEEADNLTGNASDGGIIDAEQEAYIFDKAHNIIHAAFDCGGLCRYVYDIGGYFAETDVYPQGGLCKKNHLQNHHHLFVTQCFGHCTGLLVNQGQRLKDIDGIVPPGPALSSVALNSICMAAVLEKISELPETDEVAAPVEVEAAVEPVIE